MFLYIFVMKTPEKTACWIGRYINILWSRLRQQFSTKLIDAACYLGQDVIKPWTSLTFDLEMTQLKDTVRSLSFKILSYGVCLFTWRKHSQIKAIVSPIIWKSLFDTLLLPTTAIRICCCYLQQPFRYVVVYGEAIIFTHLTYVYTRTK